MSENIYQQDKGKLISEKITEENDPIHGPSTVFHDVVIASEMVQPYGDGKALKHRDELEAYSWTVDGRWIIAGGHPEDAIISDRKQVSGKTVNPRYVKNLKDPKTGRPNRAGVIADIKVFDDKMPKELLKDMKEGKKADVSIGFFFTKDAKAGMVEDGPFKGDAYDYTQRNMFHDHLAVGIDNGRCPSPYCGLGADQINEALANDPFAGFSGFSDCLAKVKEKNPDLSDESAKKICGKLKAEHEQKDMEDLATTKLIRELAKQLMDEMEELKGAKDAKKDEVFPVWWKGIDWKASENRTIFEHLAKDVQDLITAEGDCPECKDEEEEPPCAEKMGKEHPDWTPEQIKAECEKGMEEKKEDVKAGVPPVKDEQTTPIEEEKKPEPKADTLDPVAVLNRAKKILGST